MVLKRSSKIAGFGFAKANRAVQAQECCETVNLL